MAPKLQKEDFEKIKSMQGRGWKLETILNKVGWSERTVKRVLDATNWSVYRARITRETKRIQQARANGTIKKARKNGELLHSNDAGVYEDMDSMPGYIPPSRPTNKYGNKRGEDFLGRKLNQRKKKGLLARLFKR